jgi:serralysin
LALSFTASTLLAGDDLMRPYYTWNTGSLQPALVTYSFASAGGGFNYLGEAIGPNFPFDAAQQQAARQALDAWGSVSGLHFVEVPDVSGGTGIDLRFRMAWMKSGDTLGEATYPTYGDVTLNNSAYGWKTLAPGSEGYWVLLHEIGHALGLKHPFDGSPTLGAAEDNTETTVMAYLAWGQKPPSALRGADIEAIQFLYGTQQAEDAFHIQWSWDATRHGIRHQGNDSSQAIDGTELRDIIVGAGGNDTLNGYGGDDVISAGWGTNTVAGGLGHDTLLTWLFRGEAGLSITSTGREVTNGGSYGSVAGRLTGGGEDTTFSQIQAVEFADGRLVYDDTDPVAQVVRLYQAALGRQPDAAGQEDWTGALMTGTPLASLAARFLDSPEFVARFGQLDNTGFVLRAYEQALGRPADAQGLGFWQAKLDGGMGRAELLTGFSESAENRGLTAPLLANGLWDADDHAVEAARLYQAVLGRLPEQAGLRFWIDYLDTGATLSTAAARFAESPEFQARFAAGDDASLIRVVYANTLGRAPEEAGFSFWMDKLAQGISRGDMITGFSESPEFIQHHIGMLETGITFA